MKLLHIVKGEEIRLALSTEYGVLDVVQAGAAYQMPVAGTLKQLIVQGEKGLQTIESILHKAVRDNPDFFEQEETVVYGPSVDNPEKIICIGLNYINHAAESKMAVPKEPIVFSKFSNALAAHNQPIVLPDLAVKYDYEAELVIIIGKEAYKVSEEAAHEYIFGYTVGNDLSARDLQFKSGQWLIGKTLDGFAPVGPYVVPANAVVDPHNLVIACQVNGETRQKANTKDMIFNCHTIISYLSQYMTLKPGDIIFSGTPDGVILGYPEDRQMWLTAEDHVTVTIEGIGTLSNTLIAAACPVK
ncbi:fumarylacetoacetate hydrolase family protein [Ectobacillus ponti]|uniref:Fumarylacetoacetate hydrolase family protein n=1 Tax=Ectobacillus ponti TaxID=2961894 RepID=A0AA41XCT6_9BACI|nr:fumarylacetoacetate hydrolase family protein [Ectobacillus ponti]MCP8971313.1 fumarylacetoacetate hydrolase family protein [Ectobacillus ponti]